MKLKILNTRQKKDLFLMLKNQFGFSLKLDYVFLRNERGKVYIISEDMAKIDLNKLKINTMGLYFGEWKGNELRLSLEGAQMIGPTAKENVVELNEGLLKLYFSGHDFEMDLGSENRFVILKFREDFVGCCKYKEGKILNFLPKEHRTAELVY